MLATIGKELGGGEKRTCSELDTNGLATLEAVVELLAVGELAGVVDLDLVALLRLDSAVSLLGDVNLEVSCGGKDNSGEEEGREADHNEEFARHP